MWETIEHILAFVGTMSLTALLVSALTLAICVLQKRRQEERELRAAYEEQLRRWKWREQQKARLQAQPVWWQEYPEVGEFLGELCFRHGIILE